MTPLCFEVPIKAPSASNLRDLRKRKHGGYRVERQRTEGGLFFYRVLPALPAQQGELPLGEVTP